MVRRSTVDWKNKAKPTAEREGGVRLASKLLVWGYYLSSLRECQQTITTGSVSKYSRTYFTPVPRQASNLIVMVWSSKGQTAEGSVVSTNTASVPVPVTTVIFVMDGVFISLSN
jgi:hypothetical protein